MKWKRYPAIAILVAVPLCVGMFWLLVQQLGTENLPDSTTLEPLSPSPNEVASVPPVIPSPSSKSTIPSIPQSVTSNIDIVPEPPAVSSRSRQGLLRISNPTDYPVRIALLAKKSAASKTVGNAGNASYDVPAHWDFAPQEGGSKGLLVSLPDRAVKVNPGDVLVAFAQDGSRRYWGPYVVGATQVPAWNAKATEWQLVLPP